MPAQAQVSPRPLTKDNVINLLRGDVSLKRVAQLARERGIDFQMTPEIEQELQKAGATQDLVAVLRGLAPQTLPVKPGEHFLPSSIYFVNRQAIQAKLPSGTLAVEEDARRETLDFIRKYARTAHIGLVLDSSAENTPLIYRASQLEITQDVLQWSDQSGQADARIQSAPLKGAIINIRQAIAAVIDIRKAIVDSAEGHQASAELKSQFSSRQTEIENLNKQIADVRDRLTTAERSGKNDEKTGLRGHYLALTQQLQQKQSAFNEDVYKAQADAVDRIGRKMVDVLDKYAHENGLGLVLDTSANQSSLLYVAEQLDITRSIMQLYDQAYPGGATAPSRKP